MKLDTEKVVIKCCEGSRHMGAFKLMNDDSYIGYQTAMVRVLNPNLSIGVMELYDLIRKLLSEEKI